MILYRLFAVLKFPKTILSYTVFIPYLTFMIPYRAIYNLICILLTQCHLPQESNPPLKSPKKSNAPNAAYSHFKDYTYTPLPAARCIRLLRLHAPSASKSQYIEADLLAVYLDHPLATYNAISYTWDNQTPDRYILCSGQRLRVTRNCESILLSLRPNRFGIMIWIDGICIDQNSLEEKATQVPLMSEIYGNAMKVVIWFGELTQELALMFNYLWLAWCCVCFPGWLGDRLKKRLYVFMMSKYLGIYVDYAKSAQKTNIHICYKS
jgi:hypothetical protein